MRSIARKIGGGEPEGEVGSAYLLPSMEICEPTFSQIKFRASCTRARSTPRPRLQWARMFGERAVCGGRLAKKVRRWWTDFKPSSTSSETAKVGPHAFPTLLSFASSRLPPLSVGTVVLTVHTDSKSEAGIARSLPRCPVLLL